MRRHPTLTRLRATEVPLGRTATLRPLGAAAAAAGGAAGNRRHHENQRHRSSKVARPDPGGAGGATGAGGVTQNGGRRSWRRTGGAPGAGGATQTGGTTMGGKPAARPELEEHANRRHHGSRRRHANRRHHARWRRHGIWRHRRYRGMRRRIAIQRHWRRKWHRPGLRRTCGTSLRGRRLSEAWTGECCSTFRVSFVPPADLFRSLSGRVRLRREDLWQRLRAPSGRRVQELRRPMRRDWRQRGSWGRHGNRRHREPAGLREPVRAALQPEAAQSTGGTTTGGIGGTRTGGAGGSFRRITARIITTENDCQLISDCCNCLSMPKGSAAPSCNSGECFASVCETRGIKATDVACLNGRCTFSRSCNPAGVTCAVPIAACPAGQANLIVGSCYSGGCAPVEECADVASCDVCKAAGLRCVTFQTMPASYHCVSTPPQCGANPTCACMGICSGALLCMVDG